MEFNSDLIVLLIALLSFFVLAQSVRSILVENKHKTKNKLITPSKDVKIETRDKTREAKQRVGLSADLPSIPELQIPESGLLNATETEQFQKKVLSTVSATPKNWFLRLKAGLSKTQNHFFSGIENFFASADSKVEKIAVREMLFDLLITADVGVKTSEFLLDTLNLQLSLESWQDSGKVLTALKSVMIEILETVSIKIDPLKLHEELKDPLVVMMVGVNGVGKTTTTGKLAFKATQQGKSVVVGAADTFRAAAVDQLKVWTQRSGATLVDLREQSDPASVAFEAVKIAKSQGAHMCIVDTAGRLHNRTDLMQELAKVKRVMSKSDVNAPHEIFLVLDATTGQNGILQAKVFAQILDLTGIILTKLDGTAKGGIVLSIAHELKVPIVYAGVGESVEDLEVFSAEEFVLALFDRTL